MDALVRQAEPAARRQVFAAWSIEIPASFAETVVHDGGYWHAYDAHRSVSLTSLAVSDERGPVSAERTAHQFPPEEGSPVDELPPGLVGWGIIANAPQPASRALSGMLAVEGRVLLVTITSHDLAWARRTWLSIRATPIQRPPRYLRRRRGTRP
jgi:hypothetical protein